MILQNLFTKIAKHQLRAAVTLLQDCLGYLDMNQGIYNTDRLKIGFILSYMNDGEATNWKEYHLDTLEDPNTGMPNFPTLVTFLADVQKAF
jgi:hypothetical protein